MALDMSCVGVASSPHKLEYDWRTLATYALGVGAKRDELDFLFEGTDGGIKVLPTFAVVPTYEPVFECLQKTGGDMAMVVHGAQKITCLGVAPSEGVLETTARIGAVYDLKKFAQVILETTSTLGGKPLFQTTWSIIYRGAGGFNGPRPVREDIPSIPKDRDPDLRVEEATSPEQALLYRISGDSNPLHADPAFAKRVGFEDGPILHGLATFGYLGRAVLARACGGDPARLRVLFAQFRKPVWPGDTLVTQGFRADDGRIALETSVVGKPDPVLSGYAVVE